MKKRTLLTSTLIFIAALTACGSQKTQTPLEPATPSQAPAKSTQTLVPTNTSLPTSTTAPATDIPTSIPTEISPSSISFANDVMPILNNSCNICHGLEQIKEGLDMTSYDSLMVGSFNGTVITPGNAGDSFLIKQIVEGEMPKRGPKLTAEQIQLITDWVNAGAPNN